MPEPTIQLNTNQIDFFQRHGYLTISAITTSEEIEQLRKIYDRLFAQNAGRAEGNQFDLAGTDEDDAPAVLPQILDPVKYAPELANTLFRANALVVARQLLGPGTEYTFEHAILKPAHIGAPTPWHQDEAYWDPGLEYNAISIWLPLQEATLENGCMQFISGSQQQEVFPHHSINNDPRIHGLEIDPRAIDLTKAVPCPLPAGGVTIHHCRTIHYTGPNLTDQPRRAYILAFGTPTKPLPAPRDFYWQRNKQEKRLEREAQAKRGM